MCLRNEKKQISISNKDFSNNYNMFNWLCRNIFAMEKIL